MYRPQKCKFWLRFVQSHADSPASLLQMSLWPVGGKGQLVKYCLLTHYPTDGWTCAACSAALRATPIHPAALATMVAMLGGALLVFCRLQ